MLGCAAALDPLADLWIHELAGKGDLDPLAKVCHRYVSGLDDESIAYAAESARLLRNETERRSGGVQEAQGHRGDAGRQGHPRAGRQVQASCARSWPSSMRCRTC